MSVASDEQNMDEQVCVYPTSYSQQGIWFINQMDPESAAYCIPFAYRIRGGLDLSALEKSINEIVRRHEAFRTTFRFIGDSPVQVVAPTLRIELPLVDLSGQADDERNSTLSRLLDEESVATFDLTDGPLLRASIIRLSTDEHVLLLNIHHIILDHLSVVQFARELTTLYSAYSEHTSSSLAEPILHYSDYAVWQKEWQSPEALSAKLFFWEQQKELLDNVLQLPTDGPRPAVQTFGGVEARISLPLPLVTALRELGRNEAVSMFILMLAAYKVLLHRYTDQSIISVGCPYANRGQQIELEEVMGCFINTLPLVSDFSGQPTFRDVLKSVRKSVFSVNAHQEVPFELIVEELQPTRDMSYNPMFQVGFLLQDPPMELKLHGLDVTSFKLHNKSAKFDMMIWLWDSADGAIEGTLEYNTDLWGEQSIKRFIGHYQALLESIVSNPDQTVDQFLIMNEDEQRRLLVEWNDTAVETPAVEGFHELIETQATKTPDAIAVQFGDEQLTYSELNRRASQLANYLLKQGVEAGSLVGISVERSVEMLVALLGILKTGAAYLPLDPLFPRERLAYMMDDAGISVLVTEQSLLDDFPQKNHKAICIDSDKDAIASESEETPAVKHSAKNLAYVIYTSGSTGKPKGVAVPHHSVVNFLNSMQRQPGISEGDKLLAVTTISFDISVLELFLPLISGATVVIVDHDAAVDGFELCDLITRHNINIMQATPATWRLLIMAEWKGDAGFKALCGGEALPTDLVEGLTQRAGAGLWNMYGPTETTVWSACYRLTSKNDEPLIGRPVDNTSIYILDSHMNPVPVGVPGEIYIGGEGVTQGYLGREDLTAERFVADPFTKTAGAVMYRTGDLAIFREDGNIEYIRRIDNQVKVRGFRIELGEIEAALVNHQAIRHVVADVREERLGDKRLVAYIVYEEGQQCTATELRKFLREYLPDYMVPTLYVDLLELPLTPSGKIDRKSLPNPFGGRQDEDHYVAPGNDTERAIATIWQEALGIEKVSIRDNFFDLGGHSLLAMQVINRIKIELASHISPRAMIMDTLEQVAAVCQQDMKDTDATPKTENISSQSVVKTGLAGKIKSIFSR